MDDSMLECEIEGLLAVDPAPDFRARVRQRIAQEPSLDAGRTAWRLLWALGSGGVLAAAAVAVAILLRVDAPPPTPRQLEAHAIDRPLYMALAPSAAASAVLRLPASSLRRRTAAVADMPVIIHAPEAAAWRQLFADVESGDVELPRLTRVADESTAPPDAEFMLDPIVIDPLTPESQGVHP